MDISVVRDDELRITLGILIFDVVADTGGNTGGNLGCGNVDDAVSITGAFTGRYRNAGKRHKQTICTDNLRQLCLVNILWIDFIIVDNRTQTRAGEGNFCVRILFLNQVCVHTGCKCILAEIVQTEQCGKTDDYLKVSATCSQITNLTTALGSLASTLERFLRFSGFYLMSAAFECTGTLATALMEEPIVTEAQASREKQALRDLPSQLVQLVKDSIKVLRSCPLAAKLIVSSAVVCIPSYLTKMFVQQRLVELGWPTTLLFLPLLLSGLASMLGIEIARRIHPQSLRRFYAVCALLCGGGCALVGAAPVLGCIFGCMLVQGVIDAYLLHEDQKLNDVIPSDQRATLISVDSMVYSLLMIPVSPLVGAVGDAFGQAGAGLAVLGVLVALTGTAALGRKTRAS